MLRRFVSYLTASLVVITLILNSATHAATLTRLETFASDALDEFVEVGDTHTAGSDFGFSSTNNVGLGAGEAGGMMARSQTIRAYADVDLGGTFLRNQGLHLSGSFRVANFDFNGQMMIGFFDSADLDYDGGIPFIGLGIWEPFVPQVPEFRAHAQVNDSGGAPFLNFPAAYSDPVLIAPNVTHAFSLDWSANSDGSGTISGTIAGIAVSASLATTFMDSFNAFGVGVGLTPESDPNLNAQIFVDNLVYSIVPEPNSAGLLAVSIAALLVRSRKSSTARATP